MFSIIGEFHKASLHRNLLEVLGVIMSIIPKCFQLEPRRGYLQDYSLIW